MRALTLTQPWAGVVAAGVKLVENRPRHMIKRDDVGKRFAIHASREFDRSAWARIVEIAPECALDHPGPMELGCRVSRLSGVLSAVIAVATLDSILDPAACGIDPDHPDAASPLAIDQRRWFFGPIGYVLRDVLPLKSAVPCRGWQGFWTLGRDVELAILEQIAPAVNERAAR